MSSCLAILRAAAFGSIAILAASHTASAQTFSIVYTFQGGTDGANPLASVLDVNGNLFGTTTLGGIKGTAYELTPPASAGGAWSETVLHKVADAANPASALPPYKTSVLGITESDTSVTGGGTVFQLKPLVTPPGTWKEIILHSFGSAGDGTAPTAGLIKFSSAYYGTTTAGGTAGCKSVTPGPDGCGTIFKMTAPAVAVGA
jgi:hypothetical protein